MKADITNNTFSEIILYPVEEGKYEIALNKDSESIWLNLNQIAELYQTSKANISMHIHNILKDGELTRKATVKNYLTVQIVNMFLEQAEFRTLRKQQIYTKDWEKFLDKFLMDNELPILYGSGKITHNEAKELAENAYNEFELRRRKAIEDEAEAKYLADLTKATKLVSARRKKR